MYFLSQVFVIITYTLMALTYFTKNRKVILILNSAAIITNSTSFMLLSAWTGVVTTLIGLLRNIVFFIQNKDKNAKLDWVDYLILTIFVVMLGFAAVFTYDGFGTIFSISASLTYSIAVWIRKEGVYKILGLISSLCSLIYFMFIGSMFGIILESALLVSIIVGYIKYLKTKNQSIKENIL